MAARCYINRRGFGLSKKKRGNYESNTRNDINPN